MKKCSICTKKNDRGSGPFFNVPKDENRRRLWSDICKRDFAPHDRICVDHFSPSYIIKGNLKSMLLPCAVPFINLNPIKDV